MLVCPFCSVGAFYFVRSLVQFVSDPVKNPNIYNQNDIPNNGVGWILSCAFFIDSILVGIALQVGRPCCPLSVPGSRAACLNGKRRGANRDRSSLGLSHT